MTKALLIVDVVRGFMKPRTTEGNCAMYLPGADYIIPEIQKTINDMDVGDLIIYVNDTHGIHDKEFERFPSHCIEFSEESRNLDFDTSNRRNVHIITKKRFSGFYGTCLELLLQRHKVSEVIIVGVCTDICVFATAIDAIQRDYKVTIPIRCVHGLTAIGHDKALYILQQSFGVELA